MGFIEDLKQTKDGRKALERERVLFEAAEQIAIAMDDNKLNKTELAKLLGTTKGYITQLLDGTENMTLAKVSDVLFELKRQFTIRVTELGVASDEVVEIYTPSERWGTTEFGWKPNVAPPGFPQETVLEAA